MALPWSFQHAVLFAQCRLRVGNLLTSAQMQGRDRKKAIFNYILHQELESETAFLITIPDNNPYMIVPLINEAVYMPKHGKGADMLFAYLHQRYGLSEREDTTKFVYDTLRHYATQCGKRSELRRFACYDKKDQQLFMSARNGTMWKLDGDEVTIAKNGDGVFFADDDGGQPCDKVDIGPHGELLDALTDLNFAVDGNTGVGITAELQRKALTVWMFALAFPDLMPTKPLLLLEGAPGSGKSTAAQLFQLVLLGAKKPMILQRNKEDDFGTVLLRAPIAVFDNTDSFIDWVPDAVCAYTTSGIWVKRKLFSDSDEIILRPHAFIVIASKNPASFRREDVADRCILIRLDRWRSFTPMEMLEKEMLERRGRLFGEYLWYLNRIVAEIKASADTTQSHRMADFANMAHVVGRVLGWPVTDVEDLMVALQAERDLFINEEDPLVDVLTKWLAYKPRNGAWNIGRQITVQELFGELEVFAGTIGVTFYKTARVLAQKLRSPHLESEFIIQTVSLRNGKAYKIWPRTPGLAVVGEPEGEKGGGQGGTPTG